MNIFQEIKALFVIRSVAKETIKEAQAMNGITPGWKTTEFWGKVAAQAVTLWGAISGFVPPKYAAIIVAVSEGIYTVARTAYKVFLTIEALKSGQTTVTTTAPVTTVTTPA